MTIDLITSPFAPQVQWDISDAIVALAEAQKLLANGDKELASLKLNTALYCVKEAIEHKDK